MRIPNLSKFFLFLSWLVPTFLFTSYVLHQFYIDGSGLMDVGWFTYMITETYSWPLMNPPAIGGTFFTTHFSLFFYILSFLHKYIFSFISGPVYYSLFIGSMYGVISLSTFIIGMNLLIKKSNPYIFLLLILSILTSMNGAALGLIGFPHIEIAIPALILFFFALYFTDKKILSYFIFIFVLTIREDAGFHFFSLVTIVILLIYVKKRQFKAVSYDLIILTILAFIYSVIAIYIQKTYFPGDNALERIYLGNPHFAHLSCSFIIENLKFLLQYRPYIYIPMLFTILLTIYTRNIFLLSSLIATLPWFILSFIAINPMAQTFSNYYAFPFIILSSWPIFAFAIANKLKFNTKINYSNLKLSIVLITGLSILLFPLGKGNVDSKPWRNFFAHDYQIEKATKDAVSYLELNKKHLGNILFDEPLSALMVKSLLKKEYGFLNNFTVEQKEIADTVIFLKSEKPLNLSSVVEMKKIIFERNLKNIFSIKNTNIILATKKTLSPNSVLIPHPLFNVLTPYFYEGAELPSNTGNVKQKDRIVIEGIDRSGHITFGPYITLAKGNYKFDISYISSESNKTAVGTWDVCITLPNGIHQLKSGELFGTENQNKHIEQTFSISDQYSNGKIEIRNFYNGVGNLTIKSLTINNDIKDCFIDRIGQSFAASNCSAFILTSGWYGLEPWGVWSHANAEIQIDLPKDCQGNDECELKLNLGPGVFNADTTKPKQVAMTINNKLIKDWTFKSWGAGDHSINIPLDTKTLQGQTKNIKIQFSIPDAESPKQIGMSEDARILGMGLSAYKIVKRTTLPPSPSP